MNDYSRMVHKLMIELNTGRLNETGAGDFIREARGVLDSDGDLTGRQKSKLREIFGRYCLGGFK